MNLFAADEKLKELEKRIVLLDEVVAQARESCSCKRCDFCDALAALDKYDEEVEATRKLREGAKVWGPINLAGHWKGK
jgi:hypothetical protein